VDGGEDAGDGARLVADRAEGVGEVSLLDGVPALDWSSAGIVVDGVSLSRDAMVAEIAAHTTTNQDYPTRGVHSVAHDRSTNTIVYLQDATSRTRYTMEIRVFNDGAGFRFVIPGPPSPPGGFGAAGSMRTPDEATTFHLPAGSHAATPSRRFGAPERLESPATTWRTAKECRSTSTRRCASSTTSG